MAPRSKSKEKTDYILDSVTDGKGCDTWADGINSLRAFVVRSWPDKDIVEVRSTTRAGTYATTGYIAFNPARRIYYWLPKRKGGLDDARTFNPNTGRLEGHISRKEAAEVFSAVVHSAVSRRAGHKPNEYAIDRVLDGKPFWRS